MKSIIFPFEDIFESQIFRNSSEKKHAILYIKSLKPKVFHGIRESEFLRNETRSICDGNIEPNITSMKKALSKLGRYYITINFI